jgi:hypothetical protein
MKSSVKTALAAATVILGMAFGASAQAAAYRCTDDKGKTVYSDIPCARKEPPPQKAEAVRVVARAEPATLTKLTEADVLRVITLSDDYTRSYNHAEMCNLYAADLKYQVSNEVAKPARTLSAGRDEACQAAHDSAEQSKKAGLVVATERGATKVSIEPGDTRASAIYETTVKLTRYDRVISTYRCNEKSQYVLVNGKALMVAVDESCRP